MTSTTATQLIRATNLILRNATNFTTNLSSSSSMASNLQIVLPPTAGASGNFLQTNGAGVTSWSGGLVFPPVPNNDIYRGRTNEIITINVLVGVGGNTGGTDTLGGSLSAPSLAITTVTIVTNVKYGTLTNTGLGTYTYQSFPRYIGLDSFYYKITDSSGVESKNSAKCTISIESNAPILSTGIVGPYFIYGSTNSDNIRQYNNGTDTVLFVATYPGYASPPVGTNAIATNRDDNLIYYVSNNASVANQGRIYAYDYINAYTFLLTDAKANSLFVGNASINFNGTGAVYNNQYLYIMQIGSASTIYYAISLNPYVYTSPTGTQTISSVTQITIANSIQFVDMGWDYLTKKLVLMGNDNTTPANTRITIVDTLSGLTLRSTTVTGTTNRKLTMGPDMVFYSLRNGSAVVNNVNVYNSLGTVAGAFAGSYTNAAVNTVSNMGEYISQP
jgi:hypothetical protein